MLTVDHALRGDVVCLRDSMIKFDAPDSTNIEIAQAFDRPSRYYLNRPLIMLLEGMFFCQLGESFTQPCM
jgi:RNA-dependent RNA polymerase